MLEVSGTSYLQMHINCLCHKDLLQSLIVSVIKIYFSLYSGVGSFAFQANDIGGRMIYIVLIQDICGGVIGNYVPKHTLGL